MPLSRPIFRSVCVCVWGGGGGKGGGKGGGEEEGGAMCSKANRKSQKLSPFLIWQKIYQVIQSTLGLEATNFDSLQAELKYLQTAFIFNFLFHILSENRT